MSHSKILVAFFSHTGENYGVGTIAKGNTHIVAEMIAEATGGTLFRIEPATSYPAAYDPCTEVAQRERNSKARPAIVGDTAAEEYDAIFLGYPNWWGDLPMAVYTFLEKHDWHGKTLVPFCTHEGSGLSGTPRRIAETCPGSTVLSGLAIRGTTAQRSQTQARHEVEEWLKKLDF